MEFSKTYSHTGPFWEEKEVFPFNELILSWNGTRPKGKWTFWVSLKEGEWLKYAEWGEEGQRSFKSQGEFAYCYQDVAVPKELCNQFRIKVEGEELEKLKILHVCVSNLSRHQITLPKNLKEVLLTPVPRQSQMVLSHPRYKDLCSPTSTTTAIGYLCRKKFDPIPFAAKARDEGFDIYGNWALNVAEAYEQSQIPCRVERLGDFAALHTHLMRGKPVVVSVKGSIPGAPVPYNWGHLICVVGFEKNRVVCIDSAFADNESTLVSYPLEEFIQAWGTRLNLSYIFL